MTSAGDGVLSVKLNTILRGDALEVLRTLPDDAVHCVVTSPPYWGLRDYGCAGQIGLEPTPQEYLGRMVEVFREVRRVLRKNGTAWVNMGDSYASGGNGPATPMRNIPAAWVNGGAPRGRKSVPAGLKPKDLCGMPWRLALALQEDGWWLRSEIIWAKPNPMPSSVKDRPTVAHETIFLLTKSLRYFYDHEAVREPNQSVQHPSALSFARAVREPVRPGQTASQHRPERQAWPQGWASDGKHNSLDHTRTSKRRTVQPCDTRGGGEGNGEMTYPMYSRALRSVWTIPTHPFPGAHFATFPPRLAETCIKAGCPVGGVVLDPFSGAGTSCLVASKLGRSYVGIELNPQYAAMAERRIREASGLLLAAGEG